MSARPPSPYEHATTRLPHRQKHLANGTGPSETSVPRSSKAERPPPRTRDPIVFGIDFGTTYTGVAWTTSPEPKAADIHLVKNWKSIQYVNAERGKSPTAISYPGPGGLAPAWGYEIPLDVKPIQWFKLLLLDDADLQDHLRDARQLQEARQALTSAGRSAVEVVADYLRCLWAHVLRSVENGTSANFVKNSPFRIVITVPAIWKSYVRERMRQAASLAGLLDPRGPNAEPSDLDFISEPEAAAIATFADMRGGQGLDIKVRSLTGRYSRSNDSAVAYPGL